MGYFPKRLTHDWSRNDDWGRSRKKRRLSRLQKCLFHIVKKSVITHDFRQKIELSSLLVYKKIGLVTTFGDVLDRKEALIDYKKCILYSRKTGYFAKGLTHHFGQKFELS